MQFIGVDVSARKLDICASDDNTVTQIENSLASIDRWLSSISLDCAIAMEVTNHYHLALAKSAYLSGRKVYVLNPMDVKHYAKGVGRRTKNDTIDARVIRRYVKKERSELRPWKPMTQSQAIITTLFNRRGTLVRHKQAVAMTCKDLPVQLQSVEDALKELQRLIEDIEKLILKELRLSQQRNDMFKIFSSIPGFGLLTSAYLSNLFERTDFHHADQLISFIGLDLSARDSGKKISRRHLTKRGPSEARRILYNAAMSASRGYFKPMYEHYCKRLTKTQAIVALMRKLLALAYGVWKSGKPFCPELYNSPLLEQKG